jgi:hypothetical protein
MFTFGEKEVMNVAFGELNWLRMLDLIRIIIYVLEQKFREASLLPLGNAG